MGWKIFDNGISSKHILILPSKKVAPRLGFMLITSIPHKNKKCMHIYIFIENVKNKFMYQIDMVC